MIWFNGAWLPEWLRITNQRPQKRIMNDLLIEAGYSQDQIDGFELTSIKSRGEPVAILDESLDIYTIYQSVLSASKDLGFNVRDIIDTNICFTGVYRIVSITREEFNESLFNNIPWVFDKRKKFTPASCVRLIEHENWSLLPMSFFISKRKL